MKKILHITECLGSGVLNYIKNITAWQIKDWEVYVAYATRPETPENFQEQFDKRVKLIRVKGFTREISPVNDFKAFIYIKKIVNDIRPDIIHLHSTKAGVIGRWAINCNRYHVFYSPHAYSFLMMDCSKKKREVYAFLEKLSDRKNCLTITDIDGELEASRRVTKNAICIPNGINPKEMDEIIQKAEPLAEKRNKITVCMSGKIVPQKNPVLFNEIAKEFPQVDFLWIGEGPLKDKLTSSNITITGWVSRVEAVSKIMSSDIFLFPSAWESLSIALMEVMYLGKPCIVSKADGNRDVIQSGRNGYVCERKEEYVYSIQKLLDNREKADELGRQARKDIIEKYNVKVMETAYKKLFEKIGLY